MSLLGYDNNDKTLSGIVDIYATNIYSTNVYDDGVDVGATLITQQAEIDALQTQITGLGTTGYYGIFGSNNNPNNPLTEKKLFFSQTIAQNGFTITGGSGSSATRITATYAGVYNIYYKANYSKVNATTSYDIRTWLMKNGTDLEYSTTIHTMPTTALYFQASGQFIVSLAANDYLEVVWYSPNANASSDILDYIADAAPYPKVSSQFACIQQVANTDTGLGAIFTVASTTTLAAGSSATVVDTETIFPTYIDHSLAFGIPEGDKGDTGTGVIFTVGTTTTLPQGSPATVVDTETIYPTYVSHILDFGIPSGLNGTNGTNGNNGSNGDKGDKGDKGDTGDTGPKGDTGNAGDGPIAIAALALAGTAQATAIAAGAAASTALSENAVQDGLISGLATDLFAAEADIATLQLKTTGQSWGALSGTTFANKVNVGNVVLNLSTASTFGDGISSTSTISSSSGTSQFSSLLVNNNLEISNDAFITAGELYLTRTLLSTQKKLVLYDNATGNDYDYLGFWTNSGSASKKFLNAEIDGVTGSAFQWYYGDGLGLSRTLAKYLSSAEEITYTPKSTFLKSSGASQQIQLIKDSANNKVRIDMLGDTAGLNSYDGQIIQQEGNGVDDNKGIMTLISGTVALTGTTNTITGTTNTITGTTNINTTGSGINNLGSASSANVLIGSSNTLTGLLNISGTINANILTTDATNIGNTTGNVSLLGNTMSIAGTTTNITGTTNINTANASPTSIGNNIGAIAITGATNTILGTTNVNTTGTLATSIGNTTGALALTGGTNTILGTTNINTTGTLATSIGNTTGALILKGGTNTITGITNVNTTGTLATTIGNTTGTATINSGILDINASGVATIDSTGNMTLTSLADINLSATDVKITSTGTLVGEVVVRANTNIDMKTTTGNIVIDGNTTLDLISGGDTNITSAAAIGLSAGTTLGLSSGTAMDLYSASTMGLESVDNMYLTSGDTLLGNAGTNQWISVINTVDGPDIQLTGSDLLISTTGTSTGNMSLTANNDLNLTSTSGYINLNNQAYVKHNLLVSQNSYTQPMSSNLRLGYTNTLTGSALMTTTFTSRQTIALPSKGVWLVIVGFSFTAGASNTIQNKSVNVSLTSTSATEAAPGLEYYEEIDDAAGGAILRQTLTMTGVVSATAATNLFLNAATNVNSGTQPTMSWTISWTRLG